MPQAGNISVPAPFVVVTDYDTDKEYNLHPDMITSVHTDSDGVTVVSTRTEGSKRVKESVAQVEAEIKRLS